MKIQFDFGKNWISFSQHALTKERIEIAKRDFRELMEGIYLKRKSFLDIGLGQGMSILIASEMGACVTGCDINPKCKESLVLTAKQFGIEPSIPVYIGSILSQDTLEKLSSSRKIKYDIVHSWGVHGRRMSKKHYGTCSEM